MFDIQEELKKLPGKPGVYLMHGEKDEIIYVGKAISLKNRVRQYFQSSRNKGPKIEQMVTHITRFEYIITDSELEALVLECNLIKELSFNHSILFFNSRFVIINYFSNISNKTSINNINNSSFHTINSRFNTI